MPRICPECGGEFRDEIVRCADCSLELVHSSGVAEASEEPIDPRFVDERFTDRLAPDPLMPTPENVVVFETGKLFEADLIAGVFDEEGIPYFRQNKTSGGVTFLMPAAPAMGPGDWWTIAVPEPFAESARELVEAHRLMLPSGETPGVWDFNPTPRGKRIWQTMALVGLALFAISMIAGIAEYVIELLS